MKAGRDAGGARLARWLTTAVAAGVVSAAAATPAMADGGQSIAAATPVAFGQQAFGNTASGGRSDDCGYGTDYSSWWSLPVTSGDQVTIDWEAQDDGTYLRLYALGTSDFNVDQGQPALDQTLGSNNRNELTFSVSRTGSLPLRLSTCFDETSPYDFTAYVTHALRLALPNLARISRRGVVTIGVDNPDGAPLNGPGLRVALQLLAHGRWTTVGSTGVANGAAAVPVRISPGLRGRRVRLRAVGDGPGYQRAFSRSISARVR